MVCTVHTHDFFIVAECDLYFRQTWIVMQIVEGNWFVWVGCFVVEAKTGQILLLGQVHVVVPKLNLHSADRAVISKLDYSPTVELWLTPSKQWWIHTIGQRALNLTHRISKIKCQIDWCKSYVLGHRCLKLSLCWPLKIQISTTIHCWLVIVVWLLLLVQEDHPFFKYILKPLLLWDWLSLLWFENGNGLGRWLSGWGAGWAALLLSLLLLLCCIYVIRNSTSLGRAK